MAKATVKFDDKKWKTFVRTVLRNIKDKTKLLKVAFMTAGVQDIENHFRKQMGSSGKWDNRKRETDEAYDKMKSTTFRSSNKILQLTGALRNSILPSKIGIKRKGNDSIVIFSNVEYSGVHDRGGKNQKKRDFMWISDNKIELMKKVMMGVVLRGT